MIMDAKKQDVVAVVVAFDLATGQIMGINAPKQVNTHKVTLVLMQAAMAAHVHSLKPVSPLVLPPGVRNLRELDGIKPEGGA